MSPLVPEMAHRNQANEGLLDCAPKEEDTHEQEHVYHYREALCLLAEQFEGERVRENGSLVVARHRRRLGTTRPNQASFEPARFMNGPDRSS